MYKVKILVIGPCKSGKSMICNQLADATDASGGDYHPTQGVRILEFESGSISVGRRSTNVDVELWDCGGDLRFETCWSAIAKDANGIIFVYDSEQRNEAQELEKYVDYFVQECGFSSNQCLIMVYNRSAAGKQKSIARLPPSLSKFHTVVINPEQGSDMLQTSFNIFLKQVVHILNEDQQQEEDSIVGA